MIVGREGPDGGEYVLGGTDVLGREVPEMIAKRPRNIRARTDKRGFMYA